MGKIKVVKHKHMAGTLPIGVSAISYLLFQDIQPKGTARGVVLTLFIGWNVIVWSAAIIRAFMVEPLEPVFKEKGES